MKVTRRAARGWLATLAVAGVAVTVACGAGAGKSTVRVAPTPNSEAGKTGPQVLADATDALATVPTVHVVGTSTDSGSKLTMKVDIRMQTDGGVGSLLSSAGSLQMRYVKGRLYYKGTAAFFEATMAPKATAEAFADRWVYAEFIPFGQHPPLTPKGLSEEIGAVDGVKVEPAVATETLHGQRVVVVRESDGSRLYVAATGAPLPLQIAGTGTADAGFAAIGDVTFTYGEDPVHLQAPVGAVPMPAPSGFPTNFPTAFPSGFPTNFPTAFPSGFPTALESELRSLAASQGGHPSATPAPTPTP